MESNKPRDPAFYDRWLPIIGPIYTAELDLCYRTLRWGAFVGVLLLALAMLTPLLLRPGAVFYALLVLLLASSFVSFFVGILKRGRLGGRIGKDLRAAGNVIDHSPGLQNPELMQKWLTRNRLTAWTLQAAASRDLPQQPDE